MHIVVDSFHFTFLLHFDLDIMIVWLKLLLYTEKKENRKNSVDRKKISYIHQAVVAARNENTDHDLKTEIESFFFFFFIFTTRLPKTLLLIMCVLHSTPIQYIFKPSDNNEN